MVRAAVQAEFHQRAPRGSAAVRRRKRGAQESRTSVRRVAAATSTDVALVMAGEEVEAKRRDHVSCCVSSSLNPGRS